MQIMKMALLLVAPIIGACGESPSVSASGAVLDQSQAIYARQLYYAWGSYDGCIEREGSWCVPLAELPCDGKELSVVIGDTECSLQLEALYSGAPSGAISKNLAQPAIDLRDSFATKASAFGTYFANARLSSTTFADDFILRIVFSDNASFTAADDVAEYYVSDGSATSTELTAPNYAVDLSGLVVRTSFDDLVKDVTGAARLMQRVPGERYMVVDDLSGRTYADVEAAWGSHSSTLLASVMGPPLIPAESFALVGEELPATRFIIIARAMADVRAYQVIAVTFLPAAR